MQLVHRQLAEWDVELDLQVDDPLPPVTVDANQIQQVVFNLITNAGQAIRGSGRGGRIAVRAVSGPDGVVITVDDDGPGIPTAIVQRMFEPFFTTKAEGEGTGLGLSICQGILKEHGGRIEYEPGTKGGARFHVHLPGGGPVSEPEPETPPDPGRLDILVVDDEPHIRHYLLATLEAWGHRVTVSADGGEALATIATHQFDLIISDVRMPALGGRELYERLLGTHPEAARRMVFVTGDMVRPDVRRFLDAVGRPYLRKPFGLEELRRTLARALPR